MNTLSPVFPLSRIRPRSLVLLPVKPEPSSNPVDYPETTTITQKLSKLKELLPKPIKDTIDVDKFMIVSDYQTYVEYDSSSVRQAMKDLFKDGDTKTKMETPN